MLLYVGRYFSKRELSKWSSFFPRVKMIAIDTDYYYYYIMVREVKDVCRVNFDVLRICGCEVRACLLLDDDECHMTNHGAISLAVEAHLLLIIM